MADNVYERRHTRLGASFLNLIPVTASDVTIYAPRLQGIYVGTAGNLTIENSFGDKVTLLANFGWNYCEIKKVWATGTAAAGLVGGF